MFPLDVEKAMHMARTHALYVHQSQSMAHHDLLGIVTADSIKHKDDPDTSAIADNPPVAGAAGASDPNIAAVVRALRANALPFGSMDRTGRPSGQLDQPRMNPDKPNPTFISGFSGRISARRP